MKKLFGLLSLTAVFTVVSSVIAADAEKSRNYGTEIPNEGNKTICYSREIADFSAGRKKYTRDRIRSISKNIRSLRVPAKYPEIKDSPILTIGFIGDIQYADKDSVGSREYRSGLRKLEQLLRSFRNEKVDFCIGMGDLGDGIHKNEIPMVLDICRRSGLEIRHVAGNHDFVLNTEEELKKLLDLPEMYFDYTVKNIRFIVINSLDISRFSPPGSDRLKAAVAYRKKYDGVSLRDWDGMLSEMQYNWLNQTLEDAQKKGEKVIILSHVPVCPQASNSYAWIWDSSRFLRNLDRFPNVIACFAGHYHRGGVAIRNQVLHKTVKAICDHKKATGLIARIYANRIELEGIGEEEDFRFDFTPAQKYEISGTAPAGAWIITNTGVLTQASKDGNFSLKISEKGVYALRAMADGYADSVVPFVEAPNSGIAISMEKDANRRVFIGDTGGFAALKITEDGKPVQGFDLQGIRHGSILKIGNMWQEYNDLFWSRGKYAFSAVGEVKIKEIPRYPELKKNGYLKGDFHAHIIHAESIYRGNPIQSAFIARAEGYDWIWLTGHFCNDGYVYDPMGIAKRASDSDFLCRVNYEFPKNRNGHFGYLGYSMFREQSDPEKFPAWGLIKKNILAEGGVAIPVHPIVDSMAGKEIYLILLTNPEEIPCLDLFYNNDDQCALPLYLGLLDRGYMIGITATSDAAFDVGRTPGNRGATYAIADELSEKDLIKAFRERRTMVSFDSAALMLSVDGMKPGDILKPGKHHFKVDFFPGLAEKGVLEIYRNGKLVKTFHPEMKQGVFEGDFEENGNGYILAVFRDGKKYYSVTSAIYFRDEHFQKPKVYLLPKEMPASLHQKIKSIGRKELCDLHTLDELAAILRSLKDKQ